MLNNGEATQQIPAGKNINFTTNGYGLDKLKSESQLQCILSANTLYVNRLLLVLGIRPPGRCFMALPAFGIFVRGALTLGAMLDRTLGDVPVQSAGKALLHSRTANEAGNWQRSRIERILN